MEWMKIIHYLDSPRTASLNEPTRVVAAAALVIALLLPSASATSFLAS